MQTTSRTCSRLRLTWPSARSRCASEPGSCMPVSNSTMPSPAATAQALQCGTPGQGSGRRSRHTPGTTRSPRPSSRLRDGTLTATYIGSPRYEHEGRRHRLLRGDRRAATSTRWSRCWQPGGREFIRGQVDTTAPDGVRAFFSELFGAVPDFDLQVEDMVVQKDRAAVRWRATGTFCGETPFKGIEPNGARLELEGTDVLQIADDLIVANDAFSDSMAFARQIGMMPPRGLAGRAAGVGTVQPRVARRREAGRRRGRRRSPTASGSCAAGSPRSMNVYLVRDGDGVLVFDGGIRAMTKAVAAAGARARRDHAARARPRAPRPPRHRAGARRAGLLPPRRQGRRRGRRRHALRRLVQAPAADADRDAVDAEDVGRRAR